MAQPIITKVEIFVCVFTRILCMLHLELSGAGFCDLIIMQVCLHYKIEQPLKLKQTVLSSDFFCHNYSVNQRIC